MKVSVAKCNNTFKCRVDGQRVLSCNIRELGEISIKVPKTWDNNVPTMLGSSRSILFICAITTFIFMHDNNYYREILQLNNFARLCPFLKFCKIFFVPFCWYFYRNFP
jgi:hypothetical protein